MSATLRRRLILSLIAILMIGGGTIGIAAKSGTLVKSKPTVKARAITPTVKVKNVVPGDQMQRVVILTNTSKRALTRLRFEMAEKPSPILGTKVKAPKGKATPAGYEWARRCVVTKKRLKNGKIRRVSRCTTRLRPAPSALLTNREGLRVRVEVCPLPWKRVTKVSFVCPATQRVKVRTKLKNGKYRTRIVTKRVKTVVLIPNAKLPVRGVTRRIPKLAGRGKLNVRITTTLPVTAGNDLQGKSVVLIPKFSTPGVR